MRKREGEGARLRTSVKVMFCLSNGKLAKFIRGFMLILTCCGTERKQEPSDDMMTLGGSGKMAVDCVPSKCDSLPAAIQVPLKMQAEQIARCLWQPSQQSPRATNRPGHARTAFWTMPV